MDLLAQKPKLSHDRVNFLYGTLGSSIKQSGEIIRYRLPDERADLSDHACYPVEVRVVTLIG